MTFEEFNSSLKQDECPPSLSGHLKALWHDGKEEWEKAHTVIQEMDDKTAAWIHAYLHRKEGDVWNADYWYSKAGRKRPAVSLAQEWKDIVITLL